MKTFTSISTFIVLAIPLFGHAEEPTHPAAASLKTHTMVQPADVQWSACPSRIPAGAQCATIEGDLAAPNRLFTFRVKMPDKYTIAPHYHPADEHVTVISGTFKLGLGEKLDERAFKAMRAGSFIVMPKGARHFARADGETIIQVHAIGPWSLTYVNPSDDPSKR